MTTEIAASPQACFDALTDYDAVPRWQGAVCEAVVIERDEQGRGSVVDFVVDAKVKRVRYRLRQLYDEPHSIGSEYLGGDFRDFAGEWRFMPHETGTRVELEVAIDPGRFVPRPLRRAIAEAVMRRAPRDLERHLDGA